MKTCGGFSGDISLLGVEDGSFEAFSRESGSQAILCCVEMVGRSIERIHLSNVEIDGLDASDKLLSMMDGSRAEAVILGGVTFAGFNIVNPFRIFDETGIPVIVYSGKRPDSRMMLLALQRHFDDWEMRWKVVESLGKVHELSARKGEPLAYFEVVGESASWAAEVLKYSAMVCRIPEPVRVAGLVAKGLSPAFC